MDLVRIGLGTSKAAFTLHGVDHDEKAGLRRNIKRAEMEAFLAKLPPTHVALEACGGSHQRFAPDRGSVSGQQRNRRSHLTRSRVPGCKKSCRR